MKLFSTKASETNLSNDLFKRPLTSKASEKKFDLVGDLLNKRTIDSSAAKANQKSSDYFSDLWDKKRDSQRVSIKSIDVNSFFGDNDKRPVSPFRDQPKSTELTSTGFLHKKNDRPTLAESKSGSRTPQQALKEDLNKIFEPAKTPNSGKENKLKIDTDRSYKALSQEIAKFRSSRSNLLEQSPISRPKELTPKHSSHTGFFSTNDQRERDSEKDKPLNRFNFHSPGASTTESIFFNREEIVSSGDKKLTDKFPLSKIYEIQDLFYNVSEKEFNDLSPEYVEELIKLSSVIMHRVKSSNYYTKS